MTSRQSGKETSRIGPAAELRRAHDDVEEAEVAVAEASRARFAELEKLSDKERIEHLDDPALVPADRVALRRSLQANLATKRPRKDARTSPRRSISQRLATMARRWPALVVPSVMLLPILIGLAVAWKNTATSIAAPNRVSLVWRLPSGAARTMSVEVGQRLIFRRMLSGAVEARQWLPTKGYATSLIHIDPPESPR